MSSYFDTLSATELREIVKHGEEAQQELERRANMSWKKVEAYADKHLPPMWRKKYRGLSKV
jgi:hypothetical protein